MEKGALEVAAEMDREVLRCQICGLVQYRTRMGGCRRCLRLLPPRMTFVIPVPAEPDPAAASADSPQNCPNRATVENIGQRVRQLRESRAMTQSQLQSRSRVSRSYLSRIESGQMTPSLGTLEKISEALGVGLNRFFIPDSHGEAVLEDPFIRCLQPYLRSIDWNQWQSILKRLRAISDHVSSVSAPASLGELRAASANRLGHLGLRPSQSALPSFGSAKASARA
jgi:transcriptional regulator with XRE-family HTH domain